MKYSKILKYEFLNIARNRWVFFYTLLMAGLSFSILKISGDAHKTSVTLSSVIVVLGPLVASVFTALYWYYNERFTELMLSQPLRRTSLLWMRWVALSLALSAGFVLGTLLPFVFLWQWVDSLLLVIAVGVFLMITFVGVSILFCTCSIDRMKGVGLCLGLWLYLSMVHDSIVLLTLIALKDYPMDFPAGLLGVLNPLGLARVCLLMTQDAALLLGHTGIIVRNILTGGAGFSIAAGLALLWMLLPMILAHRAWRHRDF